MLSIVHIMSEIRTVFHLFALMTNVDRIAGWLRAVVRNLTSLGVIKEGFDYYIHVGGICMCVPTPPRNK